MACLHTLNKAEYPTAVERDWLAASKPGDTILLIEEAVLRLLSPVRFNPIPNVNVLARESDVLAYGLQSLNPKVCTDSEWVDLCAKHDQIIHW